MEQLQNVAAAILDLFAMFLEHPQSIIGGRYLRAKFGWKPCSHFDNIKI